MRHPARVQVGEGGGHHRGVEARVRLLEPLVRAKQREELPALRDLVRVRVRVRVSSGGFLTTNPN